MAGKGLSIGLVKMVGKKVDADNGKPAAKPVTLKTPQSLVHIQHRITLQQYKYWILLLIEFKESDGKVPADAKGFHFMPMAKLTDLLGYTPKKAEIWSDLAALKNETISFNTLGKDGGSEKYGAGFISEWRVTNSGIYFKLPSFLEDVMRSSDAPKSIFSLLNWHIFNHFGGKYEAIIYKLCRDYIGVGRTPRMSVEEFRRYMGLDENEYPEFKHLNNKLITNPVNRINESPVSDIEVHAHLERSNRQVVGVHFAVEMRIDRVEKVIGVGNNDDGVDTFAQARVVISPALQSQYLALRSPEDIVQCIEKANEYGDREEKLNRPVDYGKIYRKAITDGWHADLAARKEKTAQQVEARSSAEAQEKKGRQDESDRVAASSASNAAAWEWFQRLTVEEQQALEHEYLDGAPTVTKNLFKKRGRDTALFKTFLLGKKP